MRNAAYRSPASVTFNDARFRFRPPLRVVARRELAERLLVERPVDARLLGERFAGAFVELVRRVLELPVFELPVFEVRDLAVRDLAVERDFEVPDLAFDERDVACDDRFFFVVPGAAR